MRHKKPDDNVGPVIVDSKVIGSAVLAVLTGALLLIPTGGSSASETAAPHSARETTPMSFIDFSDEAPKSHLPLLFIHHSVGGRLMADPGPKNELASEIWESHPEGGGLRRLLDKAGYQVHEASYGSAVGEQTDRGDWLPKFRDHMDQVLTIARNDERLPEGQRNRIVMWKSCFPNNLLESDDALARAKQQMADLLPIFQAHPEILFVHLTTPPVAPKTEREPAWKFLARAVLGKTQPGARLEESGPRARRLNEWVVTEWLRPYPYKNVAVFDLYSILTGGQSDFLAYATGDGSDSHPSRAGNERATRALVPFLNRVVRRAGLTE